MTKQGDALESQAPVTEPGFRALLETLEADYNFDVREYKETSLARRIRGHMQQVQVETFEDYMKYLAQHPDEHVALFNAILINVTSFFRDAEAWDLIATQVVPRIVEDAESTRAIRIWSAGCSSGEEPYSIAMLLAEHLGERIGEYTIKIYGTDIDEDALTTARHAMYRADQLKAVPDARLARYFTREAQGYRVRRDLRRWCIFGAHNVGHSPPLSHVDLLLCRNVLIYFTSELQDRVLSRFHHAVRTGGFLFLGRSESLLARSRLFAPVNVKWRLFERTPAGGALPVAGGDGGVDVMRGALEARAEAATSLRGQRALEALPFAVMVLDMADTVLIWNTAAERLFDVPIVGALARKFRDLDVSYRVEGLRARVEEVKAQHTAVALDDVTFSRRNGEVAHANIWILPLLDGHRTIGIVVAATDATDHARLREQMSRIAEQHATAVEELQSTNEELETTNEELQSTNEELETTNEELQSTNEELETTVEELQATNTELATLNTEMEGRSAELDRVTALHRGVLDSLDQGLVVVDRDLVVTGWNITAERLWVLRAEQALGRHFLSLPIGDVTQRGRDALARVIASGQREDVSGISYSLPGGEMRRATLRLMPLRAAAGSIIGAIGVLLPEESARPGDRSTRSG